MNDEPKERGAAQISVSLTKGVITVRHTTDDGPILAQWVANAGDWNKLWETIRALKLVGGEVK